MKLFEFGPVVQEEMFKDISNLELWQPLFQRSKTICAILVEGIMRNNSMKLFEFGPVVQEVFKEKVYGRRTTHKDRSQ